jgi:hypothetical protein
MSEINFSPLIPELTVTNLSRTLSFYTSALEFQILYERPEHKFAFLERERSQIMLEERNENWEVAELEVPFGRGINFQIEVSDIYKLEQRLKDLNIKLWKEAYDVWYKIRQTEICVREFLIQDPDGYLLRFQQEIATRVLS